MHRLALLALITNGEVLVAGSRKNGMVVEPGGVTVDDLQATLNSLYETLHCEHGPKNSEETNRVIEGLFAEAS